MVIFIAILRVAQQIQTGDHSSRKRKIGNQQFRLTVISILFKDTNVILYYIGS